MLTVNDNIFEWSFGRFEPNMIIFTKSLQGNYSLYHFINGLTDSVPCPVSQITKKRMKLFQIPTLFIIYIVPYFLYTFPSIF